MLQRVNTLLNSIKRVNLPDSHVPRGAGTRQKHVAGYLPKEISNEQNADAGLILSPCKVEILLQVIQTGKGNGISLQKISIFEVWSGEQSLTSR